MAAYNIYLVDLTYQGVGYVPELQVTKKIDLTAAKKATIKSRLEGHFASISHGTKFNTIVQWAFPTNIADFELVCYFLENYSDSIVTWKSLGIANSKSDGTTVYDSKVGTLSELYLTRFIDDPPMLADLCLHELLHNKLESKIKNKTNIHAEDKGGFGQAQLNPDHYSLTSWDIKKMGSSLGTSQKQIIISVADYKAWLSSPFR